MIGVYVLGAIIVCLASADDVEWHRCLARGLLWPVFLVGAVFKGIVEEIVEEIVEAFK